MAVLMLKLQVVEVCERIIAGAADNERRKRAGSRPYFTVADPVRRLLDHSR